MKIGFIGIGVMGGAIVNHLLAHDYFVVGFSRTKEKVQAQIEKGMVWADSIEAVVKQTDLIFTMVGFPQDVIDVYLDTETGAFAFAKSGQIFVDLTTSKPSLAQELTQKGEAIGVHVLDAPVSGGDIGAIAGTLVMMLGGDITIFEQIKPILETFTQTICYFGRAGSGQHAKMANQIAVATNVLGMAESLIYAKKAGLNLLDIITIVGGGAGSSWQLLNNGPKAIAQDWCPGFYIKHFVKDMRIAIEEAKNLGITLPNLNLAESLFTKLLDYGDGDLGTQAIYKLYENKK